MCCDRVIYSSRILLPPLSLSVSFSKLYITTETGWSKWLNIYRSFIHDLYRPDAARGHSCLLYYIQMTTSFSCPTALRLFPPLHEPGLSLVRIEYLYSVWLGSRSLISKVTCRASAGSAAARGLAWDGVTWDILSPQCVLLFYWHRGLCFLAECLHRTQRRKSTSWLWSN